MASVSSSEDDDVSRRHAIKKQELFRPKRSLKRTPPGQDVEIITEGLKDLHKTPPQSSMATSLYKTVLSAISPKGTTGGNAPAPKRILSPQEESEEKRPRRLNIPPMTPAGESYHTPGVSSSDENLESDHQAEPSLCKASGRTLLSLANQSGRRINEIIRGPMSRLIKGDTNAINSQVATILEIVGQLAIELASATAKVQSLEAKLEANKASQIGAQAYKLDVEKTVAAVTAATAELKSVVTVMPGRTGSTFAEKVKSGRGPVVALFPREENKDTIKTSEDTKSALKASIAPANLNIGIDKMRKIGGAGVLVQARTVDDLNRLKAAVPPQLKTAELKGREPLVALRNIEGNPDLTEVLKAIVDQNFQASPTWTIPKLTAECRLAYKKSRQNSNRTTLVLACSPNLRRALIEKGRLYIGWEVVVVEDYTTAICCRRCQGYGHSIKNCKADKPTCGRCGDGHDTESCRALEKDFKCATCRRFGQPAGSHRTASKDCPARIHAEKRMAESTNY